MRLSGRSLGLAAWLAALLLGTIGRSLRWRELGDAGVRALIARGQPFILVFWHGRLAMLPRLYRRVGGRRVKILISDHRDGELIARAMAHWGFAAVRGSSRQGAVRGAKGMLRAAREGFDLAITPDGPRGPREVLQEGVVELARLSGLPLVPVTFSARWAWEFGSWDRFLLPRPGSRAIALWGEPLWVARDQSPETLSQMARQLEDTMRSMRQRADGLVGRHPDTDIGSIQVQAEPRE
ncbi:MAG: lysophospholipid acyltransferase family protein [Acidithiobacillus sp.]|uniref:lysophospholipid acyltransferase family protein n=1 Tax=Acidithiobacillus sp. TaxID=1872118 RepID=UPI003D075C0F